MIHSKNNKKKIKENHLSSKEHLQRFSELRKAQLHAIPVKKAKKENTQPKNVTKV